MWRPRSGWAGSPWWTWPVTRPPTCGGASWGERAAGRMRCGASSRGLRPSSARVRARIFGRHPTVRYPRAAAVCLPETARQKTQTKCPRGDLNPHALIRALAPQASASANSATRTSAQGTLATVGLLLTSANEGARCQDGDMAHQSGDTQSGAGDKPTYDPAGEVVGLCQDLI